LLAGDGAEAFAKRQGVEMMPVDYFRTDRRWNDLQKVKDAEKKAAVKPASGTVSLQDTPISDPNDPRTKIRTVLGPLARLRRLKR